MTMKREDWQRAYVPGDALDMRVRHALSGLGEERREKTSMKRMGAIALAAMLALVSVAALAAELLFSRQVDAQQMAERALDAQYGLTAEMRTFFRCELEETERGATAMFIPWDTGVEERLGVYTVAIEDGKAQASWSFDGAQNPGGLDSPVWGAAELEAAIARRSAGEEWYEILRAPQDDAPLISEEEAVRLAREAVTQAFGADALAGYDETGTHLYVDPRADDGHAVKRWETWFARAQGDMEQWYTVQLHADDGTLIACTHKEENIAENRRQAEAEMQAQREAAERLSEEAKALAKLTLADAHALALRALGETHGLTQAQLDRLTVNEDNTGMTMREGTPIAQMWYWLWQREDETRTEGDGLYIVDVNLETGVIENVIYDSGLAGNG